MRLVLGLVLVLLLGMGMVLGLVPWCAGMVCKRYACIQTIGIAIGRPIAIYIYIYIYKACISRSLYLTFETGNFFSAHKHMQTHTHADTHSHTHLVCE